MYTPIRKADLILGGTSIKQGEIFTLGFQLFDSNGVLIIPAVGQTLTVKIANTTGVVHETTAVVVGDHIEFTVNVNIGAGKMRVELTVADGVNVLQKYPANGYIELLISASLDDIGTGNVYAVTAQEMRAEIDAFQTQIDTLVIEGDSSVEAAQARVDTANFTYTTLKARLDAENSEITSSLAEKAEIIYVDTKVAAVASGSPKGIYTTVADLQNAFPTGNTNIYLVLGNVAEVASLDITASPTADGNVTITLDGISKNVAVDNGTAEVATLDLSGTVTTAGSITVTLNGVAYNVPVALNDTASIVADKIKATAMTGWTLSGTSPQVIFTSNTTGIKTDATYSVGTSAGVTGTVTTTIQGVNADTTSEVATKIRNAPYTGWTTGGAGTTVTFTAITGGVRTDATYSAGATGSTGTITTTTQGIDSDGKWYYWNGSAWTSGGIYQSTGIANGSVTPAKVTSDISLTKDVAFAVKNRIGNYNFSSGALTPWKIYNSIHEFGTFGIKVTWSGSLSYFVIVQPQELLLGRKYYISHKDVIFTTSGTKFLRTYGDNLAFKENIVNTTGTFLADSSYLFQPTVDATNIGFGILSPTTGDNFTVSEVFVVDLTEIFGAGKEPLKADFETFLTNIPTGWVNNVVANKELTLYLFDTLTKGNTEIMNELELIKQSIIDLGGTV